jgi:acetylglutamate kinase
MILAVKRPEKDGIDFGYVGDIVRVEINNLQSILNEGFIPVFTAMTHDGQGQMLNTNADTIASAIAIAFSQVYEVELFFCFEKPGVLRDLNNDKSLIRQINEDNYSHLKDSGVIHSGMLPKIDNAFDAINKGVRCIHICHYRDIDKLSGGDFDIGTVITK